MSLSTFPAADLSFFGDLDEVWFSFLREPVYKARTGFEPSVMARFVDQVFQVTSRTVPGTNFLEAIVEEILCIFGKFSSAKELDGGGRGTYCMRRLIKVAFSMLSAAASRAALPAI